MSDTPFRAGLVAVLGRPNVGKSTLVNALVGFKVSIVSPKPQTTRHRLLGIVTLDDGQLALVDTPGIHRERSGALHRVLNRAARSALADVHAAMLVIEAGRWTEEDTLAYAALAQSGLPVVLVLNKVDKVKDKSTLLPFLHEITRERNFTAVHPVSALRGVGLPDLLATLRGLMPESEPLFEADAITDRSERFMVSELVREQLMLQLGQELPYAAAVEIETWAEEPGLTRIGAVIWVEREPQKAIVVGTGGSRIKRIGTEARRGIETLLERKVHLELWCRVRENWSHDERALAGLGYGD